MTKRRDLVRLLIQAGFEPSGGTNHECFRHPDGRVAYVPRHREIGEALAMKIKREAGLPLLRVVDDSRRNHGTHL